MLLRVVVLNLAILPTLNIATKILNAMNTVQQEEDGKTTTAIEAVEDVGQAAVVAEEITITATLKSATNKRFMNIPYYQSPSKYTDGFFVSEIL